MDILLDFSLWNWILICVGFHLVVATGLHFYSKVHQTHEIRKGKRRVFRYVPWKTILGLLGYASVMAAMVYLSLKVFSLGFGSMYVLNFSEADSTDFLWIPVQVFWVLAVMDTNYYFVHRLYHQVPFLFRFLHAEHHTARYPTVWATYLTNPLDDLLSHGVGILLIAVLPIPISVEVLVFSVCLGHFINVSGHAGVELLKTPIKFLAPHGYIDALDKSGRIKSLFNNVRYHDDHHYYVSRNYSLYFTFWDRLLGTTKSGSS